MYPAPTFNWLKDNIADHRNCDRPTLIKLRTSFELIMESIDIELKMSSMANPEEALEREKDERFLKFLSTLPKGSVARERVSSPRTTSPAHLYSSSNTASSSMIGGAGGAAMSDSSFTYNA